MPDSAEPGRVFWKKHLVSIEAASWSLPRTEPFAKSCEVCGAKPSRLKEECFARGSESRKQLSHGEDDGRAPYGLLLLPAGDGLV